MRGWRALTSDWECPIRPVPSEKVAGRALLLSRADRKKLYDMDLLIRETQEEMRAIFRRNNLNTEQSWHQMRSIRREQG